jgi:hypothetical protein
MLRLVEAQVGTGIWERSETGNSLLVNWSVIEETGVVKH